jgi:cytochrome c oxidase subunit 2
MRMVKHYIAVALLVIAVTVVLSLAIGGIDNLLPPLASEQGSFVDRLLGIELQLILFVFALIMVVMLYSVVVFRRRSDDDQDGAYFRGNTPLEVVWTIIPLGVVLALATVSANYLLKVERSAADEMPVTVVGFQWDWRFEYPDYGISSTELNMPLDRQVRFEMTAEDVIHSFWVPEFRIKQDLVPGITTTLRIRPTEPGQYMVRCAELCGTRHSYMNRQVNVMEQAEFDAWVAAEQASAEQLSPIELGAKLAQENGCQSCHSIDGATRVGPTWQGLFGSDRPLADGTTALADEAYLLKAIIDPNVQIEQGFPANVMPQDYGERLTEQEINALIAYIKSLGQ